MPPPQNDPRPIITLTTDFGLADEYAGVVKGVIYSKSPDVNIVDLCHSIPPYDTSKAAYLIASAYHYFPAGTIHVVVVDPGVGSDRDIILLEANGHLFLAPDNGVLSLIIRNNMPSRAFRVTESSLFLETQNATFHGRDIFAPLAAHLANGTKTTSVGPEIPIKRLILLPLPTPIIDREQKKISGTIIDIDHFGNCVTNISQNDICIISSSLEADLFTLSTTGDVPHMLKKSYSNVASGTVVSLFNSRNYLEIAVNQGNAAQALNLSAGDQIIVKKM